MTNGPDLSRNYLSRRGDRVVLHGFVPKNSAGADVTFPVKGTVYAKDRPRKKHGQIWTPDGRASVLGESPDDIVDLDPDYLASLSA